MTEGGWDDAAVERANMAYERARLTARTRTEAMLAALNAAAPKAVP